LRSQSRRGRSPKSAVSPVDAAGCRRDRCRHCRTAAVAKTGSIR
jgi:hypothetical protein